MRCPTLNELPPPPAGKAGWPWTEESRQLPDTMPDPSTGSGQVAPWPKVSIVTPSYNQAQFIEETIRSVLLQGYANLEYIIIDGGSTDDTVEIIKKYEPWLAHWVSEPDRGQAHAINKGWKKARGQFLGWINADDVLKLYTVRVIVKNFLENGDVDLVYGDNEKVDENGNVLRVHRGAPVIYTDMLRTLHIPIPQPGSFIRRKVLDKVGFLNEEWHVVLDRDYFVRCGLTCGMLYVPAVLAQFRLHPESKSVSARRYWAQELPQMYERFFCRKDIPTEIRKLKRQTMSCAYSSAALIATETNQSVLRNLLNSVRYYPPNMLHLSFWRVLWHWLRRILHLTHMRRA